MIKRDFPWFYATRLRAKTAIGFITNSLPQQNWRKEELQKIQSHLASLNFNYPEMQHQICSLSGGQQGKLLLLDLVLRKPNFLLLDEPTRNFSPTSQPHIRKLFATYPGGLITVSHDRRFLKKFARLSIA